VSPFRRPDAFPKSLRKLVLAAVHTYWKADGAEHWIRIPKRPNTARRSRSGVYPLSWSALVASAVAVIVEDRVHLNFGMGGKPGRDSVD
jgi:hypothetical protein